MNQQFRYRQFPAGSPLANILVVIAGIVIVSLVLTLGFFVFLVIAGFVLIMSAVMSIRGWWNRRNQADHVGRDAQRRSTVHEPGRIIEGEYHEIPPRPDRDKRR